jgi:carboxylesterase type B
VNAKAEMADYEARAEAAYAAMYDAAPHNVKDHYEDAYTCLAQAIQIATGLGLADEVARLKDRRKEVEAVYNHQFRYVGR